MDFIKKLSTPPKQAKKDTHHWADYIELLCLVNKDGIFSQTDFMDRIKSDERDVEDSEDYEKGKKNIDINEKVSLLAEDCFKILEYRVKVFADFYPFEISTDSKAIKLREQISMNNKIYFFLLFSSSLSYFNSHKTAITSSFEALSLQTLLSMLPGESGKAYVFGSSNVEQAEDVKARQSKFFGKLQELATLLKEKVVIEELSLSKYNKGDGGLDVVGWIDLGDQNTHFPIFFCQCACTPEWNVKQNSSKYDRWGNFISFSTYPMNFVFIPYAFRGSDGDWHETHIIEKTIVFDRLRLLLNFKNLNDCFKEFSAYQIIEDILKAKESVV